MSLFRKPKKVLPPLISDEEMDAYTGINYSNVLEWLVGLSAQDYAKVLQVANIYREADQKAAGALGVANEPTTFIDPPEAAPADDFLDMLEDKPKSKTTKIKVNKS